MRTVRAFDSPVVLVAPAAGRVPAPSPTCWGRAIEQQRRSVRILIRTTVVRDHRDGRRRKVCECGGTHGCKHLKLFGPGRSREDTAYEGANKNASEGHVFLVGSSALLMGKTLTYKR